MEHRQILGGEQYLSFARSCVAKLKKLGLPYASQSYEVDGASIKVRIEPGHEYIRLEGGNVPVLSGVVKVGELITTPMRTLRSFKPTQQCSTFAKGGDVNTFHDMAKLAVDAHADVGVTGSQYADLCSSMYSGTMAKVVQVLMGYGEMPAGVVQVRYDYRWERCHGVVTGADGTKWLLEISRVNGVIATRLPVRVVAGGTGSKQDVVKETCLLFGGLPTGDAFPSGAKLVEGLAAGTILQLKTAEDMDLFFSKSAFSSVCGWSFKMDGSEAHNTCYATDAGGEVTSHHYKLDISILGLNSVVEPGAPIADGTATLTEVGSGRLWWWASLGVARDVPFAFCDHKAFLPMPGKVIAVADATHLANDALNTPIYVCHVNDTLEIVRIRSDAADAPSGGTCGPPYYLPMKSNGSERYVATTTYPDMRWGYALAAHELLPAVTTSIGALTGLSFIKEVLEFQYVGVSAKGQGVERSSAVAPSLTRDGYVHFVEGSWYQDLETYVFRYLIELHELDYSVDPPENRVYTRWFYLQPYVVSIGLFPELSAVIAGDLELGSFMPGGIGPVFNLCTPYHPFQWGGIDGEYGFRRYVADAYYQNKVYAVSPSGAPKTYTYGSTTPAVVVEKAQHWRKFWEWPANPMNLSSSMFGVNPQVSLKSSEALEVTPRGSMIDSEPNPQTETYTFIGYIK